MTSQFFHSYLVAVLFVLSLGLGALFFVLVHYLARAGWHVLLRRQAEHIMAGIPLAAILALPLAFQLGHLYPWVAVPHEHARAYLNVSAFLARAGLFFVSWSLIAWWFRRQSKKQDETGDPAITRGLQALSGPALIFFAFTITFASFDWIMSLEPPWYSTIFGVYFFAGSTVSFLAFQALVALRVQSRLTLEHFHGLGKLLFGFICFWAYIAFSQYLLIWYANLPEETVWYSHRFQGSWFALSVLLATGHFVVPFFFFLPVETKKNRTLLTLGALWVLLMHYLDLYWLVMPSFHPEGVSIHWLDVATLGATGLLFLGVVSFLMRKGSAFPVRDPRLDESLHFDNA